MSELKLVSPLLDGFVMGDPISDHNGVRCCPAMRENSDDKYIVKIISVPASQKQLDALLLTGAYKDAGAAAEYFKELTEDTVKEVRLLQQLSKLEGFLPYEGWQIVPMEGSEIGYDLYLLGSYKRSLDKFLRRNAMTHLNAVNLGIDLCSALSLCRRAGFIYTALKPANIYISDKKEYRIGDLGFAKLSAMKYTSLPGKYITCYTPPELHDPLATLNPTVDTYAVGMILYQIYNNGELPFQNKAPLRYLPTPVNADYELAEIIAKAIDPNPRKRYQNPIEMGQALVAYMQRNSVNDIPIIPPAVETVAAAEPAAPAVSVPAEAPVPAAEPEVPAEEAELQEELRFMEDLISDDTAPGADESDNLADAQTSDEVDQILAQADALISEPVGIEEAPVTEEIEESTEEAEEESAEVVDAEAVAPADALFTEEEFAIADNLFEDALPLKSDEAAETEAAPEAADISAEDAEAVSAEENDEDFAFDLAGEFEEAAEEGEADDALEFGFPEELSEAAFDDASVAAETPKPRKKGGWITLVIALLILALLGGGAYYYYANLYALPIDDLQISIIDGGICVDLTTDANEALLTVTCTDTYGNKQEQPVSGGKAEFTNLAPDTTYKVSVETEGLHKVTGTVSESYTTPEVTNIVDFSAKIGTENGSVILNFTVDGPETQEWILEYAAEGEQSRSLPFTGHMVTVTGLTVGKRYTFTLTAPDSAELYLIGNTSMEYLVTEIVTAANLSIVSYTDGVLRVQWDNTKDTAVENWTVRCYCESGYDETVTVQDTVAQFENISSENAYTIEVTAEGMSQSAFVYVTANPVTVSDVQLAYDAQTGLTITWASDFTPSNGWLVMYSIDGSDSSELAQCTDNTAVIETVYPNTPYTLQIKAVNGTTVLGGTVNYEGAKAEAFEEHALPASKIQSSLCHTPDKDDWNHGDVKDSDYTTSFAPGERASLVLYTGAKFYLQSDATDVMFVIRNEEGRIIPNLCRTITKDWLNLWPAGNYCYLEIPAMPTTEGKYTVEIYFNGATVLTKNFSIITTNG